jgi:hypothetical protein
MPKRGQNQNALATPMTELNLDKLQEFIDAGRIDPSRPITMRELMASNVCGKIKHGVKLLAKGADKLRTPVTLEVSRASQAAIAAVEGSGARPAAAFRRCAFICACMHSKPSLCLHRVCNLAQRRVRLLGAKQRALD